jgi:hypothetical protein
MAKAALLLATHIALLNSSGAFVLQGAVALPPLGRHPLRSVASPRGGAPHHANKSPCSARLNPLDLSANLLHAADDLCDNCVCESHFTFHRFHDQATR